MDDLHDLAAGADDLAGAEHGLDAEDVVAGDAVLHGAHAAGVGVDVAAEAGRVLAGEHRVDEPERRELASSSSASVTPGWTTATWFSVSISRICVHAVERLTTMPPCRGMHAPDRPVPAPRAVTGMRELVGVQQDRRHLGGGRREHHGVGLAPVGVERLVVGVVVARIRSRAGVGLADDGSHRLDQIGHSYSPTRLSA